MTTDFDLAMDSRINGHQHVNDCRCLICHPLSPEERRVRSRRAVIITRALNNPEGLTAYAYTKGMTKADALQFWNDAKALGLVTLGWSPRGARTLGLRSEVVA